MRAADWRVFAAYSWLHEILLGLVAIGLSHPIVTILAPPAADKDAAGKALGAIARYPWWLLAPTVAFLAIWVLMRAWVTHRKLTDHAPLMSACRRELGTIDADLQQALETAKPIPVLDDIFEKAKEVVDRYYKLDVWPWPIGPEGPEVDAEIARRAEQLCSQFRNNWKV